MRLVLVLLGCLATVVTGCAAENKYVVASWDIRHDYQAVYYRMRLGTNPDGTPIRPEIGPVTRSDRTPLDSRRGLGQQTLAYNDIRPDLKSAHIWLNGSFAIDIAATGDESCRVTLRMAYPPQTGRATSPGARERLRWVQSLLGDWIETAPPQH